MASSFSSSSMEVQIHPLTKDDDGEITAAGTASPMSTKGPAPATVMSSVASLAQLLPTGTVLAYQALSPSFTNHGKCETSNQWLTGTLVAVLASACLFFSFTDSIVGRRDGKLYYGFATPRGFNVFNFSSEEERQEWHDLDQFRRLRLRPLDFMHAFFAAVVFLTVAFSDVGLQNCFFPDANRNTQELLKNLPMGMAFLSSFVFIIFPTKRKGIGFSDNAPAQKVVHPLN
ncbi:protein DMP10-like [Triticum dicoccoides]|uniref:protein DMP10-like n=1 Tax=Triticum dicoccoides TaxID=85692 RepID=UPI00188FA0FE|nr:protein DMP10-like [Triticum dicoccoides]